MKLSDLWNALRRRGKVPLTLYNTASKEPEIFRLPPQAKEVRMYNCGPTVYGRQHIGNLSMFVFTDVLRRTLEYNDFKVKQVINITDVGHLSSDADEGEDKMTAGLKKEGLELTLPNMKALGEKYTNLFLEDVRALNIRIDDVTLPRASGYISAEIAMVHALEEKGYTYKTPNGVYFDTSRFPEYGKLGGIDLKGLKAGTRVLADREKRSPTDFLLWKSDERIGWDSPWGMGFPGWHIECSAMIRATLGQQIDIHTGGIEHIPIHHNNEIAQSESATGKKPLARFWMHRAHIRFEGGKMAKSEGNIVYLNDITERGFHPLALRYLFLTAHYRTPMSFSWEALEGTQKAYAKLVARRLSLKTSAQAPAPPLWKRKFTRHINDDLDTPGALATLLGMMRDNKLTDDELLAGITDMDKVLGLNLAEPDALAREMAASETREMVPQDSLPQNVRELLKKREEARSKKEWPQADELRILIEGEGYEVEDAPEGPRVYKL
ncbi:MAG: cysteine--tRNA ligase [Patescibacteria group bacterium]|nr:cysteine--tRNA ligase [Patescibacteria group bacterium]